MNAYRSRPLNYPWTPFLYAVAILAALVLEPFVPLNLPQFFALTAWIAGAFLIVAAISLGLWAAKTLIDSETTISTYRCTTHLVTRGPFRYTRNPTYLCYTMMTVACGLLTGNAWFFLTAVVAIILTTLVVVHSEEMHIHARFGFQFEAYCRRTRRWI
jgi:protein-S-isoprenylcysteine O-methyltransferase Ste14